MGENPQTRFSENIQELFSSGTVILFTCAATADFPILSVSENSEEILGFTPSYFLNHKHGWSNQIHPDDKDRVIRHLREVVEEGDGTINEYRFKRKDGSYIWLRDEIKLINNTDDESVIYGSSIDITDRKRAEIALKENKTEELRREIEKRKETERRLQKRLSYEKAISKCSGLLLEGSSSEALRKSLNILKETTRSDRVYLYKNQEEDGKLYLDLVLEVTASDVHPAVETNQRFEYSDIRWWHEKLSAGDTIHAQIEDLPEAERAILREQKVKSVLVIPITVNGEWFGYIGFAETREPRRWHEDEISLLKTVAGIIGAFEKRKIIEKSLVQQRGYTETILDSLPSIYFLMNKELQFVQWNSNAEKYTGYSAEELKNKSAFDLIAPSDHEGLGKATRRAKERKGDGIELHLLTKSGKKYPYFWRGYYIELDNAEYFLCVGLDISQQKRTEKELTNEKRFNETLLESLPGIFYMFDEQGRYKRWNQNLLDDMGFSEEEMKKIRPSAFFSEKEYKRVEKEIEKVFSTGKTDVEAHLRNKEGEETPYFLTGKLFALGEENYLIGMGYDISKQKEARERLKRSEQLFRNLFLKAPSAIVMVGPENKIKNVNTSFENLFGYSEEELVGEDIDEVIVPEENRGEVPRMPLKSAGSESFYKEAKRLTKSGELIDVFVAAIPVYVEGKPIAGFGMYIDITEQKRYEKEIYSSLKEKHVLLQEIHHRVKNNLAVVSGLLQLQMYEIDDPVIQETLKESENRIQTMALIHEKLYNSQNLSRISCDSYIGDLVETIRNTIQTDKEITVNTDIEKIELNINKAVPFALLVNEVVTNSFKHAFKKQKKGKITINLLKKGQQLHAQISDNGSGLPDDLSPEKSDSLGMKLISNFAKQLEAEWELGSDGGTYIDLRFDAEDVNGSSSSLLEL